MPSGGPAAHKTLCKETQTYKANQEVVVAKEMLAEQEAALGVDRHETLGTLNRISVLLQDQGNIKEAEPFYRRDLEGSEWILGPDHSDTLASVSNTGMLLQAQAGQARPCRALPSPRSQGCERVHGPDCPHTLTAFWV